MRAVRAAIVPFLLLAVLFAVGRLEPSFPQLAHFDFIWDVLVGALLGVCLCLLPALSGFPPRKNKSVGLFWIAAFAALLLIFYQYMTLITGMRLSVVAFLTGVGSRVRVIEGAVLGYCSVTAGRGKI